MSVKKDQIIIAFNGKGKLRYQTPKQTKRRFCNVTKHVSIFDTCCPSLPAITVSLIYGWNKIANLLDKPKHWLSSLLLGRKLGWSTNVPLEK